MLGLSGWVCLGEWQNRDLFAPLGYPLLFLFSTPLLHLYSTWSPSNGYLAAAAPSPQSTTKWHWHDRPLVFQKTIVQQQRRLVCIDCIRRNTILSTPARPVSFSSSRRLSRLKTSMLFQKRCPARLNEDTRSLAACCKKHSFSFCLFIVDHPTIITTVQSWKQNKPHTLRILHQQHELS